jgi:HSP20 family protein
MMKLVPYTRQFAFSNDMLKDFWGYTPAPVIKTDIKETDEAYVVEAELPGVKKENVALMCKEGVLTIAVKTSEEKTEENDSYIRKERVTGEAKRSFVLKDIKEEEISAKMEDGILYVTLPKKVAEDKKIEIE